MEILIEAKLKNPAVLVHAVDVKIEAKLAKSHFPSFTTIIVCSLICLCTFDQVHIIVFASMMNVVWSAV